MKAVAFIRTSTDSQEVESQKKELINYIKHDGYSDSDIVVIGHAGASAIKEDEEYQAFKSQLYSVVDAGDVDCVYVWELSRLGRKKVTIYTIIDYLQQHKVNLKIFSPQLYLLEPNGTINTGMELAISMYVTFAEQEMRTKKDRFRRAKLRNSEEGRYNGGKAIPFGYSVGKDNYFVVNEDEAKVVLTVFNKYAAGTYSLSSLANEMNELGHDYITIGWLHRVLSSTIYLGYHYTLRTDGTKKANRTYPRIVSDELYNTVQEALRSNFNGQILKQSKHFYFAKKLILCDCGRHFTPCGMARYACTNPSCDSTLHVSIPIMDGLAWSIASHYETEKLLEIENANLAQIQKDNATLETKLKHLPDLISKVRSKLDRAVDRYIDGALTEEKYQQTKAKIDKELQELEAKRLQYETKLSFNNSKIEEIKGVKVEFKTRAKESIGHIRSYTEEEKQAIVHKYITEIKLFPRDHNNIVVDIKTIYGYLTCMIHPFNKRMVYETMTGEPILIESVYRDRDDKPAYTLDDSLRWKNAGEAITKDEERRLHFREKWLKAIESDGEIKDGLKLLNGGRVIFLAGLHQEAYNK